MILVIPLLNNGKYDQLRFALRSITTHHSIERCIIVGGKPDWYTGEHIHHKDYGPIFKEHNIRDKVIAAGVEGEFLFANDDHILLAQIGRVWDKGLLSHCLSKRVTNGSYTRCLRNTFDRYGDVSNVDTHCPMFMTSEGLHRTQFEWPAYGIGFKTCYAQENSLNTEYMDDCKVSKIPTGRLWFSLEDNFPLKELFALFPDKCKFEV